MCLSLSLPCLSVSLSDYLSVGQPVSLASSLVPSPCHVQGQKRGLGVCSSPGHATFLVFSFARRAAGEREREKSVKDATNRHATNRHHHSPRGRLVTLENWEIKVVDFGMNAGHGALFPTRSNDDRGGGNRPKVHIPSPSGSPARLVSHTALVFPLPSTSRKAKRVWYSVLGTVRRTVHRMIGSRGRRSRFCM